MSPTPATSDPGPTYVQLEDAAIETLVRLALMAPIIQVLLWVLVGVVLLANQMAGWSP